MRYSKQRKENKHGCDDPFRSNAWTGLGLLNLTGDNRAQAIGRKQDRFPCKDTQDDTNNSRLSWLQ